MKPQIDPGRAATDPVAGPIASTMDPEELGAFLNMLLEAERAGARLLADYVAALPWDSVASARLLHVQRDEARNCAVLIRLLTGLGITPSRATGDFYQRGLKLGELDERVAFLNRGQGWVAKRIASALPRIGERRVRAMLSAMHHSHLANIALCEALHDHHASH